MLAWLKARNRWEQAFLLATLLYALAAAGDSLAQAGGSIRLVPGLLALALGAVVALRLTARLGSFLASRFLWRVRHRMILAYLLIGVVPLSLIFFLATFGALLTYGPLAAYIVGSRIEERAAALFATADSLAWQLRAADTDEQRIEIGRKFISDARTRYPGLLARLETPRGPISIPPDFRLDTPPLSLRRYRGLVRRAENLFIAAFPEYEPGAPSLLLMIPITDQYLADLVPGLGAVAVNPGGRRRPRWTTPGMGSGGGRPIQARLPPPAHPLDWTVGWEVQSLVLDWGSGSIEPDNALILRTRPSAVARLIVQNQTQRMRDLLAGLGRGAMIAFGVVVVISTVFAVSLTRTITRAVNELYVGTRHVDQGDFSHRIPIRGNSQLSELKRSFNEMTASIERLIEDSRERQRLESELAIAQEVQSQLFPRRPPRLETFEVFGACRAARSVSGDFYDYARVSDDRVALSFGDVSGKGISAALVMAAVHSTVRAQLGLLAAAAEPCEAAARMVAATNRRLAEDTAPDKFATLFFGIYDQAASRLTYVNAGHLPPVLLRNGEARRLESTGMVVGAFPDSEYEARSIDLLPDDLLVAFTDGVTEPENPYDEEFGEKRLCEALLRDPTRPLAEIISATMDEVRHWCGDPREQVDDMTMLAARRLA